MEPAGCGYWRRAAAGEVFYTVADDHKRCPVGAHTHNVTLSPSEQQELMGLVQTMVGLSYLKMEDVPQIPTRRTPLQVAVYAPLDAAPVPPDVVLVRGNARQLMLLAEAAQAAGVAGAGATMGRPTCSVLPEAINSERTAASFGCVGNRVYTGAGETEALLRHPGPASRGRRGEARGDRARQPGAREIPPGACRSVVGIRLVASGFPPPLRSLRAELRRAGSRTKA